MYYVYLHTDPKTGEVVYVGKGVGGRAWDVTRCRREHKEHQQWMLSLMEEGYLPTDWVSIYKKNMTEEEAFKEEVAYLHTHGNVKFDRRSGEKNYQAKLTCDQVKKIFLTDKNHTKLAKEYGVSRSCISMIKSRKQWRSTTACLITPN
jgi:hypothetical protein